MVKKNQTKKVTKRKESISRLSSIFYGVLNFLVFLGRVIISLLTVPLENSKKLFLSLKKNFTLTKPKSKKTTKKKKTSKKSKNKAIEKKVNKKKKAEISTFRRVFYSFAKTVAIFMTGVIFSFFFIYVPLEINSWLRQLPQPILLAEAQNRSTRILDRNGQLLYEIYVDRKYAPVAFEDIPQYVIQATLAVEDDQFYNHIGIRPKSMIRAARAIFIDDELQGGSTITQQLIKNVLLTTERTISRKTKEVVLALMVERTYSKNEILNMYFNNIPYGGTAWGIQAAADKFFGKDVSDLTLAEGALLAALPSAPSVYSPTDGDTEIAKRRQKIVLNRMVELNYITEKEAQEAYDEDLNFTASQVYIRAPHFVNAVKDELVQEYGERMVDFGGLTVRTTLDLDLHERVQQIVTEEVAKNENLNISNGAAVVLDSQSGEVLAYVGSENFFSEPYGAFDVARAYRQPGSSIKVITYALALEKGLTPATTINDSPLTITSYGQTYSPKNYDGKYHGNVTLRSALANSYNIPAVKVLSKVGADNMVELGQNMGLQGWKVDATYGLSVTLGGKEVRLLDLTNVYATFARQGMYKDTSLLQSVRDKNGFEIFADERTNNQVISPETAYLISNILSDNKARTPAFGPNSSLVIKDRTVAVKTGTTDLNKDNLTVGYTPKYTVGVWVGNNNNDSMNRRLVSGLSGAAPIWNRIMTLVLENRPDEPFVQPKTIFVKIDPECGNKSEVFVKGTEPRYLCDVKKRN